MLGLIVGCGSASALAGPVEFGRAELASALSARGMGSGPLPLRTMLRAGAPESFQIAPGRVVAADPRGLMYGLLAAAEQIRATGRLTPERGAPEVPLRGVRLFLHNRDLEREWYYAHDHWRDYFAMLARQRFNRFTLVFAHQTSYLAPPYPFWVTLPAFPQVRVPGLSEDERRRNLDTLRDIAQTAADHGIDFTLGIWQHDIQADRGQRPSATDLTAETIGPYSYAALRAVLAHCPAIRSVQVRTNSESGIPSERQAGFFGDYVFRALRDAGRPVGLDLRGWDVAGGTLEAAERSGLPLRVSAKYWAEHLGRPYQPAETYPNYSYRDFLRRPRGYDTFFELWGLGSHRLLLWGDPGYVRRAVATTALGGAQGFEIDPPLAQKGFGDEPGLWGVFTAEGLEGRRFWRWEWERYWLFYTLWGRLGYDPGTLDAAWTGELARRFGPAGPHVLRAYEGASAVLNEIVAAHMADPNMYVWPEINPGGLVDAYKDVPPSDRRFVATMAEAVDLKLGKIVSAKQTPTETAARLDAAAAATDAAVADARAALGPTHREWRASESDFRVLAHLARYHARKQLASLAIAEFDRTGDPASLAPARRELETALAEWEALVGLTDGLYPADMAFGPHDAGHWRDKLPYVRHDLELVAAREAIAAQFGRFTSAFDFGGAVAAPGGLDDFHRAPFVVGNTVAPRFRPIDPSTGYDSARGYGWLEEGRREARPLPLTPYLEVRAVAKAPTSLPRDVLFGDSIAGEGRQVFAADVAPGDYEVALLRPDRSIERRPVRAPDGHLRVELPDGAWAISGLVVYGARAAEPSRRDPAGSLPPRPAISHQPPPATVPGRPLALRLTLGEPNTVASVRLHHRPVNQLAKFATIEAPDARGEFVIPGAAIGEDFDLMYYFEILDRSGRGWFWPDPHERTPYVVVPVSP